MRKPRVLIFDIEASDLEAGFGTILCIGYKWLGEKKVYVIDNLDKSNLTPYLDNDSRILKRFRKVYEEADYSVAHFGQFYDLPFIQSRLIIHGLPVLPPTTIVDTWKIAKKKLRFKSNSLKYIARALRIKTKKTELDPLIWRKAARGHRASLKYIVHHCDVDVRVLEAVFQKISPLVSESLPTVAHQCGDKYLQKYGVRVCAKKLYQRFFCKKCKGWLKGKIVES